MLLWLNGAFGAGKTSVAEALCRRLPGAFLYDPENAGQFLRQNLPGSLCPWENFQDDPLWRQFNRALLGRLAREYSGPVVVPMTVTEPKYWAELTALVPPKDLRAFVLRAEPETLLSRLRGGERRRTPGLSDRSAAAAGSCNGCPDGSFLPTI